MRSNFSKLKIGALIFASSIIIFNGCSNDQEKKTDKTQETKSATSSNIEIVKNENADEIKVEEKDKQNDKGNSYYFDYNAKTTTTQEKPRTPLDANLHVRSPYEKVQISMLVKSLSKEFIVKCSACHNDYANGIIGPSLLGKSSDFIFDKIKKFQSDRNANIFMSDLVSKMDDKEIRKLADEIFNFNKEIKQMRNK